MSGQTATEHELKLGVWPGFELPDLRGAINGAMASGPQEWRLEAVYFDTPDLRLLRRGVTVRFRRGEEPGDVWTAKLPDRAPAIGLARREISIPGAPATMPALMEDLVRGWALGAALVPVARLRTLRQRTTVRRPGGEALAVVDDDEVSIVQRSRVAARFRELELELVNGASPKLLAQLAQRMRAAGAQPVDQMPKLVRALGPSALAPWDLAAPTVAANPSAGALIQAALVASAASLVDHLAAVVLDEDLEGVHQARVGIRRLRSDLKTAQPLLHFKSVRGLRCELDWLMDQLGEVRDLDVLLVRLRSDSRGLDPVDRAGADAVLAQALQDRAEAYERLLTGLRTPRCAALLEETSRLAAAPPFRPRAAGRPAAEVLPRLVRGPLKELQREVRKQGPSPDDEGLHRIRISVKRVRYAAELAAPAAGRKARRAARGLADVQRVLGEHNDACVAGLRLRDLGSRTGQSGAWAAGLFGGLQLARAAKGRKRFRSAWAQAAANKRWRWTKG
ncbi:MAG TPA: CYTH and CHAD domain-containing protein [Solirubrobacteraceae bacterium]